MVGGEARDQIGVGLEDLAGRHLMSSILGREMRHSEVVIRVHGRV